MALPTGLLPTFAFVLTLGVSVPVAVTAHLLDRDDGRSFDWGVRVALVEAGLCYLVGVGVVWAIAGGEVGLWELPVTLVLVGVGAGVVLVWMPLTVGTRVVQRLREVDRERALRATTAGWPVAMLVVFAIFVVPGGSLLGLAGGPSTCLVGFCGVSVWLLVAVCLEGLIAVFGPGLIGAARTKAPAGETQAPTGN